jgi:hypothetical protein
VYYSVHQIVAEKNDEYYLIELQTEKSLILVNGKNEREGIIYEYYDEENIYRVIQVGKKEDWKFNIVLYWNHSWGKVPAWKLKGVPFVQEGVISYVSPFMYAVDLLDLCTINHSILQAVMNRIGYPHTVMIGNPCQFEHKDSAGTIHACGGTGHVYEGTVKISCPECSGTGLNSRLSPTGVILINPKQNIVDQGDAAISSKPLEFISPGVDQFKLFMELIEWHEQKARRILHLHNGSKTTSPDPEKTATGEVLDNKARIAFTQPIAQQTFSTYEGITNAIAFMRYGEGYEKPQFTYPTTFDLFTEEDYINQLKTAKDAGLPPFVIHTIIYRFLQSIYYNETMTARVFNLIIHTDRLLTMSSDDVRARIAGRTANNWEAVLHDSAIQFIAGLVQENEKYFEQDFAVQQEQLIAKAKEVADGIATPALTAVSRVQSILNPAA